VEIMSKVCLRYITERLSWQTDRAINLLQQFIALQNKEIDELKKLNLNDSELINCRKEFIKMAENCRSIFYEKYSIR
jgi:hypothetical protein